MWRALENVVTQLGDPLGEMPKPPDLTAVTAESEALARDAYERGDAAARGFAERLLYQINWANHFAAPTQPAPAIAWSILARALGTYVLREFGGPFREVAPDALNTELTKAVDELGGRKHPLLDEMFAAGDQSVARLWGRNWYSITLGFSLELTALSMHCPMAARRIVVENLNDELKGTPHRNMRQVFLSSLGVEYEPVSKLDGPERVIESFTMANYRTLLVNLPDPARALGAFYSVELAWCAECSRLAPGLRSLGLDEKAVEVFALHAETDAEHSEMWVDALRNMPFTPADCGRVLQAAIAQLRLRNAMYDAIRALARQGTRRG